MRTKHMIVPFALALLVTAAARTGFFFADGEARAQTLQNPIQGPSQGAGQPSLIQPMPGAATGSDPGGYCCIPSYASANNGQCYVGVGDDASAIYYTEGECETGIDIGDGFTETGILWNGDQSLCNFYCGEALGLYSSSASSVSPGEEFACEMCNGITESTYNGEAFDDAESECGSHPECEWIPDPQITDSSGAVTDIPARCAPNPDAPDDNGYYLCDFSYGCCRMDDVGDWEYIFGFSQNGDYIADFEKARACVVNEEGADASWMTRWEGVPDGDAATGYSFTDATGTDSIDDFREECEAGYGSSSSAASSESSATAKENLYCDRRLMPTTVTNEIQCWLREKSNANQSPLWGTVFFTPVFYSDRPLDADGIAPLGRTIPDPIAGDQCEDRCWTAMDYGACCIDFGSEFAADSCKGATVADCIARDGVVLPFTEYDSPDCQIWAAGDACSL